VLERGPVQVLMADLKMPGMSGVELLRQVKSRWPQTEVLIMTAYATVPSAVEAMKLGACDYLAKPFNIEEAARLLDRIVQGLGTLGRAFREGDSLQTSCGDLIGAAPSMQELFRIIARVSQKDHPVLIVGESGTGKELVARAIHESGPSREREFLPVDCGSLVPTLIESELFGYVRGAFTGAMRTSKGLLEAAEGGTVFLDEIADLPVDLQAKLLRALQEREVRPIGSTERLKFDARIIAATNRDLDAAVQHGTFRKDLYFRLNVVTLNLPPLRDRKEDIPLLVNHFLEKFSRGGQSRPVLSEKAMDCLMAYDWPGNVRELENCIQRALALSSGATIGPGDLPTGIRRAKRSRGLTPASSEPVIRLQEVERQAIMNAMVKARGDKSLAAKMLGIGKSTLYRKLRQYNIR